MAGEKKKQPSKVASKKAEKEPPRRSAPKPKVDWPVFTEQMEKSLLGLKSEILGNLIAGNKDFKEIVEGMDPKDFADIASDDIDRKMIEVIGAQELRQLRLIESALTRINQGKYGFCIKCEKRIPPDRLEAIPYALMCIDCKSEEERRNR
jgi:RNA polymerase-binding transcription factor DksA